MLAMHLCDIAKAGEKIPTTLPPDLIPPTFRRQRLSSLTSSQNATESIDPLAGMPQVRTVDEIVSSEEKKIAMRERSSSLLADFI